MSHLTKITTNLTVGRPDDWRDRPGRHPRQVQRQRSGAAILTVKTLEQTTELLSDVRRP